MRSQTRYHCVYGTADPPVGEAGAKEPVLVRPWVIDAGEGSGASAKSAKSVFDASASDQVLERLAAWASHPSPHLKEWGWGLLYRLQRYS